MARQTVMTGMERKDVPKAVLDAAQEWLEARREARRARETAKEKLIGALALMDANKTKPFKILDEDIGEYFTLSAKTTTTLQAKKAAADEVDERPKVIDAGGSEPKVRQGLIEQAAADMNANNVGENEDGDVTVPEKPAAKRTKKPKKGGK